MPYMVCPTEVLFLCGDAAPTQTRLIEWFTTDKTAHSNDVLIVTKQKRNVRYGCGACADVQFYYLMNTYYATAQSLLHTWIHSVIYRVMNWSALPGST